MQIISSNIKFTTDLPKAAFVIIINGLMMLASLTGPYKIVLVPDHPSFFRTDLKVQERPLPVTLRSRPPGEESG